ncbi:MAG: MBL fold metallo-hydrolase [Armatimonadota bacterium]
MAFPIPHYKQLGVEKTRITFLGTGTSHGVPVIGCKCPVCTSQDHRNRRTRTSALIAYRGKHIIIDTAPEFRLQCLANNVDYLDGVLFTHAHADHIFGLDDVRGFNRIQKKSVPCYGSQDTLAAIRRAFAYIFIETQEGGGKPKIELNPVDRPFEFEEIKITPIPVMHGEVPVYGYRIGKLAYVTDCSCISDESKELLRGLDLLILGVVRRNPHETHLSLVEGVEIAKELAPGITRFVHMSHHLEHESTNNELPSGIELAYDGLSIELSDPD